MREINPTPTYQEAMRLIRLRRRAKRQGLKLTRSRWHQPYIRNRGGFALLNSQNEIIAGDDYSLDLDAAENLLSTMINHGAIALPQQTRKSGPRGVEEAEAGGAVFQRISWSWAEGTAGRLSRSTSAAEN
ncbi:hypothetical protein [Methylobacterium phyllosphaerae]|uniref:hypothetical protein n=1 Tax=Methylobacterium phyllosphaerae TaxID=418223 RepID=UPI000A486519|nr:hypothetical protein [Methylobacterium phyllosphaerae]